MLHITTGMQLFLHISHDPRAMQVADTGLEQEEWQPVPPNAKEHAMAETPVFRNAPVANEADRVALKEKRPPLPLPPIKRPVTPPAPIQGGGPSGFYTGIYCSIPKAVREMSKWKHNVVN